MYDYIVVGAGIIGSWTACIVAERGYRTLLIDQFPLPHSRGSSHGQSRIFRMAYINPTETAMVQLSLPYWKRLEKEADEKLFFPSPHLTVCEESHFKEQEEKQKSINMHNPGGYEWLTGEQLMQRYPGCRFSSNHRGLLDLNAGVLRPSKSLRALQQWFVRLGGDVVDGFKVDRVTAGPPVTISGSKGEYRGKKLIVCAGPWSQPLLKSMGLELPLKANRTVAAYYKEKEGYRFPDMSYVYTGKVGDKTAEFYALPSKDYPGLVKMSITGRIGGVDVDPDECDDIDWNPFLKKTQEHIRKHWPNMNTKVAVLEYCIYTLTPDKRFILDVHPRHPHVAFSTGYSGTGFKIAPAIGEALTDLVEGRKPKIDNSQFKVSRFFTSSKL